MPDTILPVDEHVDITLTDASVMRPMALIALYQGNGINYTEIAEIETLGQPGTFKPMSVDQRVSLANILAETECGIPAGFVPPGLLYLSYRAANIAKMIFTTPAGKASQTFHRSCEVQPGIYPVPALLWYLWDTTLYLFAYKDKELTPKTKLYYAPFMNVQAGCSVCMGTGSHLMKGKSIESTMHNIQKAFYETVGTHTSTKVSKRKLESIYQEMYATKATEFPLNQLVPYNRLINVNGKIKHATYGDLKKKLL